jgi:hypothetical protein
MTKLTVIESRDIDITEKRKLAGTGPACNRRVTSRNFVAEWSKEWLGPAPLRSLVKISGRGATIDDAIENLCAKTDKKLGITIWLEDESQKFLGEA